MSNFKKLKYTKFPKNAFGMEKYINQYRNHHSKFIHNSWLLLEDLGREVTIEGKNYTIWGMWENDGRRCTIMLDPVDGGYLRLEDSRNVANALGYRRMRNAVTGEEHNWDFPKRGWTALDYINSKDQKTMQLEKLEEKNSDLDDESEGEWPEYKEDEDSDYVDPLIKALQDDITDDGDISSNIYN